MISIIIPTKEINNYLRKETIPFLLNQTYEDFEIIIVVDRQSHEKFSKTTILVDHQESWPADKRDLGAKRAKGEILAFLDDDSYPNKNWLERAIEIFREKENIVGVCGPALTPSDDSLRQKASGYVWSTWLGSGGAGTYRCTQSSRREVDDYPTVNFLVRKKDFLAVGGFNSHFWPGEDTKLCHDLVYKLGKKIVYDPEVLVYHHRRPVFKEHLKQIGRYAIHRGHFVRVFPKTSLRLGYLLPTIFVTWLALGFWLSWISPFLEWSYWLIVALYGLALFLTAFGIFLKEKDFKLAFLVASSIFLTHLVYGTFFIKGFLSPRLER